MAKGTWVLPKCTWSCWSCCWSCCCSCCWSCCWSCCCYCFYFRYHARGRQDSSSSSSSSSSNSSSSCSSSSSSSSSSSRYILTIFFKKLVYLGYPGVPWPQDTLCDESNVARKGRPLRVVGDGLFCRCQHLQIQGVAGAGKLKRPSWLT